MHPAREISIGNFRIGGNRPLVLIAGPCVIESEAHAFMLAERFWQVAEKVFWPSFLAKRRISLGSKHKD
jgi:2-dehydro-3-deoxyphosphooctonate aldolase (KDO 8-P synthase)